MQLPLFFEENLPMPGKFIMSEESSKHIVQVLRMQEAQQLLITNGKGEVLTASLVAANKKNAEVTITGLTFTPQPKPKITVGISLIKNANRFEWFLEKATEIGVGEIIPFISGRTEKQHFRHERMKKIVISAMLQSQQAWLPLLHEPVKFTELIKGYSCDNQYIAHCIDEDGKRQLADETLQPGDQIILIGPEGDFTKNETDAAFQNNYIPVSLGKTRLRTETAAIVAAVLLLNRKV